VGTATNGAARAARITEGKLMRMVVTATNGAGLSATIASDGVVVDSSNPAIGSAALFPAPLGGRFTLDQSSIRFRFGPVNGTASGAPSVAYMVGSRAGAADILPATPLSTAEAAEAAEKKNQKRLRRLQFPHFPQKKITGKKHTKRQNIARSSNVKLVNSLDVIDLFLEKSL
jgi:hypothetical protein